MNRWQAAGLAALFASTPAFAAASEKPAADKPVKAEAASPAVATLDGGPISEAELDAVGGSRLFQARSQLYNLKRQILEEAISKRLVEREAAARGVTSEALLKAEVDDKGASRERGKKKAFYESNKGRFGGLERTHLYKKGKQLGIHIREE